MKTQLKGLQILGRPVRRHSEIIARRIRVRGLGRKYRRPPIRRTWLGTKHAEVYQDGDAWVVIPRGVLVSLIDEGVGLTAAQAIAAFERAAVTAFREIGSALGYDVD